jgi:hypothetical protein
MRWHTEEEKALAGKWIHYVDIKELADQPDIRLWLEYLGNQNMLSN